MPRQDSAAGTRRNRRRLAAFAGAVGIVIVAIAIVAILVRPNEGQEDARAELQSRVTDMYSAVFRGDYASAYQYRSQACRDDFAQEEYVGSMRDLLGDKAFPGSKVHATVQLQSDTTAVVTLTPPPGPDFPAGSRTWTKASDGKWYFDNCQARTPGPTP